MKHKVIQNNLVLHHGEKNNSSNPFSYQENPSRQRAQRFKTLVSGSKQPWRSSTFLNKYIVLQKRIRLVGSLALVLLFALTAFTLRPVSVSTDFAEATANPATTTLTMTTGYASASLDITPSSTTGTFASSSDDELAKFTVSTNNITGYNLSISHADATTPAPLTNEDLSTDLASLPAGTSITDSEFNTSTYVGYYGYKPSMLNSADNSNYIPAPTTNSTTLNKTTQANTTSDNYTIALGANIDYTKSAGTYTNTFILTAVANNVAYTINYLDNTGDPSIGDSLPAAESGPVASAVSFELSSTTPTRTGYTFAGWCDGTVTHNAAGNDTCSSTPYPAGSTYSFASPSSTSINVANLYAMWNVKTFAITLAKTNATAIVIDGTSYTGSSATLTYGNHTISGTYDSGYEFDSWSTSDSTNLAITSTSSASTTITVHGAATLTLNGKISGPTVIIKNVSNMTKVSLNGTECTSTSGCTISGLTSGTAYRLKAYYTTTSRRFTGWTVSGSGTIVNTANAETTFIPNVSSGTITITPSISTSCTAISSSTYMQDFSPTSSHCDSGSLKDRRDNQIYTVARLNGGWWMTRNLAIGCNGSGSSYGSNVSSISLTSTYSNVSTTWSTPTALLSTAANSSSTSGYTTAAMQCSSIYGAWYNYAAASAGTITGSSNSTVDTYNICPKGWTLPTISQQSDITSYSSAFSPVTGGYYGSGSLYDTGGGYWWSATANNTTSHRRLSWNGSSLSPNGVVLRRYNGIYVRCFRPQPFGCFTAGSQVQVSLDGETKNIEDIRIGDEVVSYDPDQKEYYMTEILDTIVHDGAERFTQLVELTLDDNTQLNMTKNHPILTKEGYKAISEANYPELTDSDIVITTSGEHSIRSIRIYDTEPTVVYNLTVRGRDADDNGPTHSYIVNGVVVHNGVTSASA